MERTKKELDAVLEEFLPGTASASYLLMTDGIINETYHVKTASGDYLLQRINSDVFKNPEGMMENIVGVTAHLERKHQERGLSDQRHNLTFLKTKDGKNLTVKDGSYWRVSNFIEDSITLEDSTPLLMEATGKAFGAFAKDLADYDSTSLIETIPDFHNTGKRIQDFYDLLASSAISERVYEAQYEINVIAYWKDWLKDLSQRAKNGTLPLRVTHNDTKTNNILFDKTTKEVLSIIDLDTVMPGLACYDVADAIRFSANTAPEDESDMSKVSLDMELFTAFLKGYLSEAKDFLTKDEKETLVKGIVTITFEQGIRFLGDYFAGDVYYKTTRPKQNLDRARCQFHLFEDMMAKYPEMEKVIRDILED